MRTSRYSAWILLTSCLLAQLPPVAADETLPEPAVLFPAESSQELVAPVRFQVTDALQPPAVPSVSPESVSPVPTVPSPAVPTPSAPTPSAPAPSLTPPPSARSLLATTRGTGRVRRASYRLARVPDIFGDFSWSGSAASQVNVPLFGFAFIDADVPLAGGSRRIKIGENNRALPTDRAYFVYNHFHNALEASSAPAPNAPPLTTNSFDVDRYTIGFEKIIGDSDWSIEVRMPFTGRDSVFSSSPAMPNTPALQLVGGKVGDLGLIAKRLVYLDECSVISAGVGLTNPTGSDVFSTRPGLPLMESFSIENRSFHLLPFVAAMSTPSDDWFWHGFAQLDLALNGNRVDVTNLLGPTQTFKLNDQALLHLDVGVGQWLYREDCSSSLTGLAALLELHYTTTLQDADIVPLLGGFGSLGNTLNRVDVVNLTAGLHAQFQNGLQLRFGAVVPLTGTDERFFDSELQAAVIRRF